MVIQTVAELEQLQRKIENEVSYVMPVFCDQSTHPAVNTLSSLHFLFDDGTRWCVPYKHPDAISFSVGMMNAHKIVTLYKRDILHAFPKIDHRKIEDVAMMLHLSSTNTPEIREYYTPTMQRTLQQYSFKNLHLSIPLAKWIESMQNILNYVREKYTTEKPQGYDFATNIVIPTLTTIERSGLHVDPSLFGVENKRHIVNNMVYSEYNPYTSTGRPSNRHGGTNFAALNKHDGSRAAFTSRYGDDGLLIQLDYEAFHPRLIAKAIGYQLPNESVHTYLAKQYYEADTITNEQYEASKQRTFSIIYGMTDDLGKVDFFHKIRHFTNLVWQEYQEKGYIIPTSNSKKIQVEEPSANKVFNYCMQWLETEEALGRVSRVCSLLDGTLTKPILYTYDALLLDLHRSETALLPRIKALMEGFLVGHDTLYPTRMYKGKNYNELMLV